MRAIVLVLLLFLTTRARADVMPLLGIELGAAELRDLERLASAVRPEDMIRLLDEMHDDLELQTMDEDAKIPGRYVRRFESGPRGILKLTARPTRDVILHEYLHYLIDRVRLFKHAAETLALRKSYRRWAIERSVVCENPADLSPANRVRHYRECLDGILFNAGEEIEVFLFLHRNRWLNLDTMHLHARYALKNLDAVLDRLRLFERLAQVDFAANAADARWFPEVEARLREAWPVMFACASRLDPP